MREGWELKTISEISKIVAGGTPKTKVNEFWNGEIAWITPADLGKLTTREVELTRRTITEQGLQKSSAKLFPENSVILSTRAPIGHLAINTIPMATNQGCRGIVPNEDVSSIFLYYFLKSNIKLLNDLGTGATFKELSTRSLGSVKIPIPPLSEQKQIVAILDQAFEAIDQAKANIEKNIENAKELFQSKLNEIFSQKGEGWINKQLSDIGEVQTGTTPPTKDKTNYGNFIPFVKPPHFQADGSIVSGESMLSKTGLEKGRLFRKNSILMVCIGATIGKTGFSTIPVSSNQQINALTPNDNFVPKLLYYALISPYVQKQIMDAGLSAQATLPIINKSKWMKIKVNLPLDKITQTSIVNKLDNLKNSCLESEILYLNKIQSLEELKKSILQKAFSGELTSVNSVQTQESITA